MEATPGSPSILRRLRDDPWFALTCGVALAMFAFLLRAAFEPLRLNWGDPWSDVDIRIAGRFFARYGFLETRFAGIVDVQPLTVDSYRYVHYPPLGMLINGVLQKVFRTEQLPLFRCVALGFSALSVFFFFKYVRAIWSHRVACFATLVFATNALWVKYADCIYSHPLHLCFGFASLFYVTEWFSGHRLRHLLLSGAAAFLCFFSSYDFFFFIPVAVCLTPALLKQPTLARRSLIAIATVGAFCLASIVFKSVLAIWAIGWTNFCDDVRLQFFERATPVYSFDYRSSLPNLTLVRLLHFFSPTVFVVFGVYVVAALARIARHPVRWLPSPAPLVLLAAGVPFLVAMSQLFAEQYHPSLCVLPFAAVGLGVLVAHLFASRIALWRGIGAAGLAVSMLWGVADLARSPKAFVTDDELARVGDFIQAEDKNPYLYSNSVFSAAFRYSFNRQLLTTIHIAPEGLLEEVVRNYDELGERPVHYVQFDDIEHAAIDCKFQSFVSVAFRRHDWLEDPWSTQTAWMAAFRQRDAEFLAQVREVGVLAFEAGGLHVYRIEPGLVRAALARRRPAVTEIVHFGEPEAPAYLVRGFRGAEHAPVGGFRWLMNHAGTQKRLVLTAYGLKFMPTGERAIVPEMGIDLPAGRAYRVELSAWSAVEQQNLRVFVNGFLQPVDIHFDREFDRKSFFFTVPPEQLRPSGAQTVTFEFDRTSPFGVGVALFSLTVTKVEPQGTP